MKQIRSIEDSDPAHSRSLELTSANLLDKLIQRHIQLKPRFSFRQFSAKLGLKSPNYIQQILSGKKKLSIELGRRICENLKVSEKETQLLVLLLEREKSQSQKHKDLIEMRIDMLELSEIAVSIDETQLTLFSNWFVPVVWILAEKIEHCSQTALIEEWLHHAVTLKQIDRAIDALISVNLLKRTAENRFQVTSEMLEAKTAVAPVLMQRFYESCAQSVKIFLSKGSAHCLSRVTTLSIDCARVSELKARIKEFHAEIIAEFECAGSHAGAVQVSSFIQTFR